MRQQEQAQAEGRGCLPQLAIALLTVVMGGATLFAGAIFLLSGGHPLGWFIAGVAVGAILGGLYLLGYAASILFVLAVVLTASMFFAGQQYNALLVGLGLTIIMFMAWRMWRGQRQQSGSRQPITWEMYSSQVPTPVGRYHIKDVPTGEIVLFQSQYCMVLPPRKEENTFWYFLLTPGRVLRMKGDAPVMTGFSFEKQAAQYQVLRARAIRHGEEEQFGFTTLDRIRVGAWVYVLFVDPGRKPAVLAQYLGENHIRYWEDQELVESEIIPNSLVLRASGYIARMAEAHVQ